jgi:hypothetical protein
MSTSIRKKRTPAERRPYRLAPLLRGPCEIPPGGVRFRPSEHAFAPTARWACVGGGTYRAYD